MEFKPGDKVEVFTSPGVWMAVEVYAVGPDWLAVGNGDPVYGPEGEVRASFRVHVTDARFPFRPVALGDIVAVLNVDGEVAYRGEVVSLPTGDAALRDTGKIGVWNPDTDDVHYVAAADGEGLRHATEEEADGYLDAVIAVYGEDHEAPSA